MKKLYLELFMFAFIAIIILYLWSKPHRSIENIETIKISAELISEFFEKDETRANKKYLNKALTVTGKVKNISVNSMGRQVMLLQGSNEFNGVQCVLEKQSTKIKKGTFASISGFCSGFTLVVILDDCQLIK